jgi:hypothetical protein
MFENRLNPRFGLLVGGIVALGLAAPAHGNVTVPWFTVDSGGALRLTAGDLALSGTTGQADAAGTLSGGSLSVQGGFWVVAQANASLPGDCNNDGTVDVLDFLLLCQCPLGPDVAPGGVCACFDFDVDGDVDLRDISSFQCLCGGS